MDQDRRYEQHKIDTLAAALYDGGWRAEDKDLMMEEYGFTEENMNLICNTLQSLEAWEAAEWLADLEEWLAEMEE